MSDRSTRRVLCLSGSLRRISANTAVLKAAIQLAPTGLVLKRFTEMGRLPLFNPDDETEPLPPSVSTLREQVGRSDALLLACPEYAHGVPGAFKNLLDWLVGSLEFPGKPVVLINTSSRGSHHAEDALVEILRTMSARVLDELCCTVPLPGAGSDVGVILLNHEHVDVLSHTLSALLKTLTKR